MSTTPSYSTLRSHFILFIPLGALIWTINLFGQLSYSGYRFQPFLVRSLILAGLLILSYSINNRFSKKNGLNRDILKYKPTTLKHCLSGCILGFLLIAAMWGIMYLVYPFEIISNPGLKVVPGLDIISYSLGNTLEELLFRGFLLLAAVKLLGKTGAVFVVSLLFGLFHLPGLGLTVQGLTMVITTFTMSLLFIAVIDYTASIWTAVTLHITINLLLHTSGFDGAGNGLFHMKFAASGINRLIFTLVYEIVVIAAAALSFMKGKNAISTDAETRSYS